MNTSRAALLGGLAMMAVAAGTGTAQAQVQMPGWFGAATGWYVVDSGNDGTCFLAEACAPPFNTLKPTKGPGDGWGGSALLGYRFMGNYDVAIGGAYVDLSKNRMGVAAGNPANVVTLDARYFAGDIEVGYTFSGAGYGVRPFIGARYADWRHNHNYVAGGAGAPAQTRVDYWGVGPRIGVDATGRVNNWLSVFGGVSGSVLFGKIDVGNRWTALPVGGNDKDGRTVWNADGKVGLAVDLAPQVALAVGYRAEYWNGVANDADQVGIFTPLIATNIGSADRLMHGPFARISYNIGAPRPAPVAAAPAPAPAAVMTRNFIVFFDWDRSDLTMQAKSTISQAAAASKTGGVQRINVTGHADKSGGDAYNMALSLRRANTVRDDLVRNGVPANAIVVVARGESQPLVPTADGVREPQNRRVEIVLQ